MLSLDIKINQQIIANTIAFHRTGKLIKDDPVDGIEINKDKNLQIDYGFEKKKYGTIVIKRGQFEVIEVSNVKGELVKLEKYNHSEHPNRTKQDYIDALKCKGLNKDSKKASAVIILLSESCRSLMVLETIIKLLTSQDFEPLPKEVWAGLEFAFKNYGKTAKFLGYHIKAGEEPWEPLIVQNYLDYINSDTFKGKKAEQIKYIEAVDEYLLEDSNFPDEPDLAATYPYSYTLDTRDSKKFIFKFSFEKDSEEVCNPTNSHYVDYRILRNDKPKDSEIWKGCLSINDDHQRHFHLDFSDKINLKGTMKLFRNLGRGFIWCNAAYGHDLEERFEGNILEIPKKKD